jgi:hypothetical protein
MKNKFKVLRIITFVVVIIAVFINCGPPRLKGTVSIEGIPHIGSTLTANIASLGGSGIITYQWLKDGSTAISDTNSYTLQPADRDAVITVTVIRSDNSGSITSAPVTNRGHIGGTGPGGGIIFYHDPNGFTMSDTGETAHFLEAAPANVPSGLLWASSGFTERNIPGTEAAIGTGRRNTALILAIDGNAPAALACSNFSNNGKDDWFLPSADELNALFQSRAAVGNLGTDWFWSSSQLIFFSAWGQFFSNGNRDVDRKYSNINVRAVRAF